MGWIGNTLLIICVWRIGYRDRWAFLCGAAGGFVWSIKAYNTSQWDLLAIEIILSILQLIAWRKWGQECN